MNQKLLFACFVIALASCTKDEMNEITNRKIIASSETDSTEQSDEGFGINILVPDSTMDTLCVIDWDGNVSYK